MPERRNLNFKFMRIEIWFLAEDFSAAVCVGGWLVDIKR